MQRTMMIITSAAFSLGLTAMVAGCGSGDSLIPSRAPETQPEEEGSNARTGYASFQQRLNVGADCQELYEIRNEVRRLDQSYADRMNEDLRAIECYSSTSSRTPYESIPSTVRELTETEVAVAAAPVQAACTAAMQAAAAERSVDLAQPLLVRTAYECPTVDIWLATLRTHPGAMGLNERAQIGELSIQAMCSTSDTELRDSPLCQDAYTRGMAQPLGNIGNNIQQRPCIPIELSPTAVELVRLYDQLHAFKDDPEFIRLGFGQGGPYSAWLQKIQRYRDTNSGFEIVDELGFLTGELMMLGMNYIGEDPSESDLSAIEFFERKIQAGLASARCDEIDPNWRGTIQASLKARQSYAAEAEAQLLARESLLGRPLTEEELTELAFAKVWDVLGLTAREDEELALAQLRPLIDQMHEIGEQRKQEYEAALDQFEAAARAAEQGHGSYTATMAEGEAVLALATEIAAEMLALAMELADLEATAPPEVAALAATNRVVMEQAFALFESVVEGLQGQLEVMRDFVAELSIDEQITPRSPVTLEMLGDARLAIKDSDDRIVEVSLGGQGGIGNRQRSIYLEVLRGTSILHAKELGENAVRIVERSWSDMEAADYTIVVSRTGPPVLSSRESDERIIVEGSKGRFESDISWK